MSNSLVPTKEEFEVIEQISKHAVQSKFVEKLGGLSGVMTIAMYCREIGVGPLAGIMGGFSNIQGKITMSAEMMNSLIRRAGHKLHIEKCDNDICTIKGERSDTKETAVASFTMMEARAAGLVKAGGAWEKYTSDMLFARCLSRLRRRLFPDIATKSYVEGELEESEVIVAKAPIEVVATKVVDNSSKVVVETVAGLINHDEAMTLEALIGDDMQYRKNLLEWLKIESLMHMPKAKYPKILEHARKYNEKKLSEEDLTCLEK